jgi:hypothetical protein
MIHIVTHWHGMTPLWRGVDGGNNDTHGDATLLWRSAVVTRRGHCDGARVAVTLNLAHTKMV